MQRPGKTHKAAMSDSMQEMSLRNFFRTCAEILTDNDQPDSSFYFEQIMEHINSGKGLPQDKREIQRVLGL